MFVSIFVLSNRVNAWSKYEIGKKVTYNGNDYYVIENSDEESDIVTMLKDEPLTYEEIIKLNLTNISVIEYNEYGVAKYGESINYDSSYVKKILDSWKQFAVKDGGIVTLRLLTLDDLVNNLGYEYIEEGSSNYYFKTNETPKFVYTYNGVHYYWTMTPEDDSSYIIVVRGDGGLNDSEYSSVGELIRPVIEIKKSAL